MAFQLFIELVTGDLGSMVEHEFASKVVRVIIAGNSLSPAEKLPEGASLRNLHTVSFFKKF